MRAPPAARLLAALALTGACAAAGAEPAPLALAPSRLELEGVPVVALAIDLDRDGLRDLAVVTASTGWGEIGIEEQLSIDESGALAEVLTVVPALLDRRELAVHAGRPGGGFEAQARRLELPATVHAVEAGPRAAPLVAWTDEGVSEVVPGPGGVLALVPRIVARTLFAGSTSFLPRPRLAHDLDGDGDLDLLVPVDGGLQVHLSDERGLGGKPASRVTVPLEERLPGDARHYRQGPVRRLPLPEVRDLDGDRRPELLFRAHERGWNRTRLLFNRGAGSFGPPVDPLGGAPPADAEEVVWIGDLDGDGRAELVGAERLEDDGGSLRAELAAARRPRSRLRIHRLGPGALRDPAPAAELEIEGYLVPEADESPVPGGLADLDGDGRLELIAVTLDFSLFEAARALTARAVEIGFAFAIWSQREPLRFRPVPGLELTGELRVRLDRAALGQLSSFAGDFDGDGRADFVQLGPGRRVAIHRGREGPRFSTRPDLVVTLAREPADARLVRIEDFDGDGRSDLALTRLDEGDDVGRRATLELYLSRGAR